MDIDGTLHKDLSPFQDIMGAELPACPAHRAFAVGSCSVSALLLDQHCHQASPARLVACAKPCATITVKVFVEQKIVAPVGITLQLIVLPIVRAASRLVPQEEADEALREFIGHLLQGQILARSCRALDLKIVAVVMGELLQRLDQQVVDGKPDWAAPVGVAAEYSRARLSRFVGYRVCASINVEYIRMPGVILAERANAIVTQKLIGGKHVLEQAFHAVSPYEGQQVALACISLLPVRDQAGQIGPVGQKPCQVVVEPRQSLEHLGFKCFHRAQRDQPDKRADF